MKSEDWTSAIETATAKERRRKMVAVENQKTEAENFRDLNFWLFEQLRRADTEEQKVEIRNQIGLANMPLLKKMVADVYSPERVGFHDVFQAVFVRMVEGAIPKFDHLRGISLSTYLKPLVRRVVNSMQSKAAEISLPRPSAQKKREIEQLGLSKLFKAGSLSAEERELIREKTGWGKKKIKHAEEVMRTPKKAICLDAPAFKEGGTPLIEFWPDEGSEPFSLAEPAKQQRFRETVERVLGQTDLSEGAKACFRSIVFEEKTQIEVGKDLGITNERARQKCRRVEKELTQPRWRGEFEFLFGPNA